MTTYAIGDKVYVPGCGNGTITGFYGKRVLVTIPGVAVRVSCAPGDLRKVEV